MGKLEGQVAIVTGGGRGLGRSIALGLAAEGAAVAIDDLYRDEASGPAAEAVAREIEAAGGQAIGLCEDISSAAGAQAMVDATIGQFGKVDILVACAGNTTRAPLQDLTEQQWDSVINLHLKGTFLSCQSALRDMLKRGKGRIVTVGSRGAFFQVPESKRKPRDNRPPPSTAYSAAKAGIMGLTTTLAVELWETDITANCLIPSATTQLFPETKPRMVGGIPATANLDPDYVAPLVVYLCTDDAAEISGRVVYASGGDILLYGPQMSTVGSRMIRKLGKWTQSELAEVLPPLIHTS